MSDLHINSVSELFGSVNSIYRNGKDYFSGESDGV